MIGALLWLGGAAFGGATMLLVHVARMAQLSREYEALMIETMRAYREIRRLTRRAKVAVPPPWFPERSEP